MNLPLESPRRPWGEWADFSAYTATELLQEAKRRGISHGPRCPWNITGDCYCNLDGLLARIEAISLPSPDLGHDRG